MSTSSLVLQVNADRFPSFHCFENNAISIYGNEEFIYVVKSVYWLICGVMQKIQREKYSGQAWNKCIGNYVQTV